MNHQSPKFRLSYAVLVLSVLAIGCGQIRPSIKQSVAMEGQFSVRASEPRFIEGEWLPESMEAENNRLVGTITIKMLRGDSPPRSLALELGKKHGCDFVIMELKPYAQYTEYDHNDHINPSDRYSYVRAQFEWEKDEYRARCYRTLNSVELKKLRRRRAIQEKRAEERAKKEGQEKRLEQERAKHRAEENRKRQTIRAKQAEKEAAQILERENKRRPMILETNKKDCAKGADSFDFLSCSMAGRMILPEFDSPEFKVLPKDRPLGEKYLFRSCMEHPIKDRYGYGVENCKVLIKYLKMRNDPRIDQARKRLAQFKSD